MKIKADRVAIVALICAAIVGLATMGAAVFAGWAAYNSKKAAEALRDNRNGDT